MAELKKAKFQIFLNRRKQPCFRLRAPNGEIILQSDLIRLNNKRETV